MKSLGPYSNTAWKRKAAFIAVFFFSSSFFTPVYPLPSGEEVVAGSASFDRTQDGSTLNINAADQSIIQYSSFQIGTNETVNFYLPSDDSTLLNRILGGSFSEILGTLTGNGRIMLVNENGFYFGPNSFVDVGSLLISTHDISNGNFLAGNYVFENLGNTIDLASSSILNEGVLQMREGGSAVLIADQIENRGTIRAPLGMIHLAGGEKVTVGITNDGLFSVLVDEATARRIMDKDGNAVLDQIKNTGTLEANGGAVQIQAKALEEIFESAINLEGFIHADSVQQGAGGSIKLLADDKIISTGTLSANSGEITMESEKELELGGKYLAEGGKITFDSKGDIEITGNLETEGSTLFRQYGNWINDSDFDLGLSSILFEYIIQEMDLSNYSSAFADGFTGLEFHLVTSLPLAPREDVAPEFSSENGIYHTRYGLRDGIMMDVIYERASTRPLEETTIPVKQTLSFDNPTSNNYDLELTLRSYIQTNAVDWNGASYTLSDTPLHFTAYEKTASITEFAQDAGLESLEGIEPFSNMVHTYWAGHFLTYDTPDDRLARFDWDDVMNLSHEVIVSRFGESAATVDLNLYDLTLPAGDTLVVDPEFALSDTSAYNLRLDGDAASTYLTDSGLAVGDVNGDGVADLVVSSRQADNNGSNSGSAWVIFSTLINTLSGNQLLSTSTNYNIRYDGAAADDQLTAATELLKISDVNGDGKGDLLLGTPDADNNGGTSGSLWVMFSTLIDDVGTSTGNNQLLSTASNYNIRYDGVAGIGFLLLGNVIGGDVNGDGLGDLILGAANASNNGANSGSAWVLFSTLIDDVGTSTGNNKVITTAGNYNIRFDGGAASNGLTGEGKMATGDVNGDGLGDLVLGASGAANNGGLSGSAWVIFSTLIDDVGTSTGNNQALSTGTNYNIRYDGGAAEDQLTKGAGGIGIGDVNGDGLGDLVLGGTDADNNGASSGSYWVMFSTLIDDVGTSTGNNQPLSTGSNYNIRYDGAAASDQLGITAVEIGDVNGDGLGDLIFGTTAADNNGASSGSVWVFFSTLIDDVGTSTANNKPLSTATNYNIRFDGAAASDVLSIEDSITIGDWNRDGKGDLILGSQANNSNAGSVWVIYSTLIDDVGTSTGNNKPLSTEANSSNHSDIVKGSATGDVLSDYGGMLVADVNGDGLKDLILGASQANTNGSDSGAVYVIFGANPPPPPPPAPPPAPVIIESTRPLDNPTLTDPISSLNLNTAPMTTDTTVISFDTNNFVNTGTSDGSFLGATSPTSPSTSTTTSTATDSVTSSVEETAPAPSETVETPTEEAVPAEEILAEETAQEKPAEENQGPKEEFKKEDSNKKEEEKGTKPKPEAQTEKEGETSDKMREKPFYQDHPWDHFGTEKAGPMDTTVRVEIGTVEVKPFRFGGHLEDQKTLLGPDTMNSTKWNQAPSAATKFRQSRLFNLPKVQLPTGMFLPSLEGPQRKAVISKLKGNVQIFKDGLWQPAAVGMTLGEKDEIRTSPGSSADMLLDDKGSTGRMELKEKSYARLNTMEFNSGTKEKMTFIDLALGLAKFYVEKLKNNSKFEVNTPTAVVGVRGTVFEVEVNTIEAEH